VLLVVASQADPAAQMLVDDLPRGGAALLTPRDLSTSGWDVRSRDRTSSVAVAGGERIRAGRISGVVTLLPCVFPQELVHIAEADRQYVAAEMTAFLLYWLSGLTCPVLNRPTPGCLSGPNWRVEQWCLVAAGIGIDTIECARSTRGTVPTRSETDRVTATLVGGAVIGSEDEQVQLSMRRLAAAASVELMTAMFLRESGGCRFAGAFPFADVGLPDVRDAIVSHFTRAMVA
jgi:hypothetical protein